MSKSTSKILNDRIEWHNSKGELHREDGPAIERDDGTKQWWRNGKLHRLDGPANEWADGNKEWWVNGQRHRGDGPAVIWTSGTKAWWVDGQRHRLDGPAIERADGTKWKSTNKKLQSRRFLQHHQIYQKETISKLFL